MLVESSCVASGAWSRHPVSDIEVVYLGREALGAGKIAHATSSDGKRNRAEL